VLEPIKPIDQQMTLNKSGILSGTLDPSDSHNLDGGLRSLDIILYINSRVFMLNGFIST